MAYAYLSEIAKFAEKNGCKHEIEDLLGLKPHGILSQIQEGKKPNIEGTKLWNVLSIQYDVSRGISKEERRLYLNGCLSLARQVRQRLTNLKNMVYKVIKG